MDDSPAVEDGPRYCHLCGAPLAAGSAHQCAGAEGAGDGPRYCGNCGAAFPPTQPRCPSCRSPWLRPVMSGVYSLAAVLTDLQDWRRQGVLDETAFARLRDHYEARLARRPAAGTAPQRAPAAPAQPAISLSAWAAKRQADIVLYLGAFLLSIAALIFVSYQGNALGAPARVAILAGYTVGFIVAGVLVRRWERVREAGHVFVALGALFTPLNFILFYTEVFRGRGLPGDVLWLLGSVYCALFYGVLAVRGFGTLYRVPAAAALLSGWGALFSVLGLPVEWAGAWYMLLALTIACLSLMQGGVASQAGRLPPLLTAAVVLAAVSLLFAHLAGTSPSHHAQLPAAYALVTAGICLVGVRRRAAGALPLGAAAALAAVLAAMWTAGVGAAWYPYPILLLGGLTLATRPWWAPRSPVLARAGWAYAAACAVSPLLFLDVLDMSWHGATTFALGAALLGVIAWRNREHGISITAAPGGTDVTTPAVERALFGWAAAAFAFGAVAYAQQRLGIARPDTGWSFMTAALVTVLALGLPQLRGGRALLLLPVSLAAVAVSLQPWSRYPGHDAVLLAAPAVALLLVSTVARRWLLALPAASLAGAALAAAWAALGWPVWTLAATYSATGAILFAALGRLRDYRAGGEREVAAVILSWSAPAAGVLTALAAVALRWEAAPSLIVERTVEYRALVALVLLFAPLLAYEGLRLRAPLLHLPASAVAIAALLMGIAIARPSNVQAYTVPLALYLLAVGLVVRRSPAFIPPHVLLHELAVIAGAACLVLPQAAQSFDPGGARWGLVLLGEGLLFLSAAFVLHARWLAAAGIGTLSGVAVRWLIESGDTVPYWLSLGLVGIALLGAGVLILLEHDRWERFKLRASRWWQQTDTGQSAVGSRQS